MRLHTSRIQCNTNTGPSPAFPSPPPPPPPPPPHTPARYCACSGDTPREHSRVRTCASRIRLLERNKFSFVQMERGYVASVASATGNAATAVVATAAAVCAVTHLFRATLHGPAHQQAQAWRSRKGEGSCVWRTALAESPPTCHRARPVAESTHAANASTRARPMPHAAERLTSLPLPQPTPPVLSPPCPASARGCHRFEDGEFCPQVGPAPTRPPPSLLCGLGLVATAQRPCRPSYVGT